VRRVARAAGLPGAFVSPFAQSRYVLCLQSAGVWRCGVAGGGGCVVVFVLCGGVVVGVGGAGSGGGPPFWLANHFGLPTPHAVNHSLPPLYPHIHTLANTLSKRSGRFACSFGRWRRGAVVFSRLGGRPEPGRRSAGFELGAGRSGGSLDR
jgi:hypothetical protein